MLRVAVFGLLNRVAIQRKEHGSWIRKNLARPLKRDPEKQKFTDAEATRMLHRAEREPYGAFAAAKKGGFTTLKALAGAGA